MEYSQIKRQFSIDTQIRAQDLNSSGIFRSSIIVILYDLYSTSEA